MPKKAKTGSTPATATNTDPEHFAAAKDKLDAAWVKTENGLKQEAEGKRLWVEGTLELIQILDDARKRLGSDQAFGAWLNEAGYGEDKISRDNRQALLNMGLYPDLSREVLEQTTRQSWRLIWLEEVQSRLRIPAQPAPGKPSDSKAPKQAPATTRRPKKVTMTEQEPAWFGNTDKWVNDQFAIANKGSADLTQIMDNSTPDQHYGLAMAADKSGLAETFRKFSKVQAEFADWLQNPPQKEAHKKKQKPARAATSAQLSA